MNPASITLSAALRSAPKHCELCGETEPELRLYGDPTFATDTMCRACFIQRDGENDFTDFPLVKGATHAQP